MIRRLSDKADEWLRRMCAAMTPGARLAFILITFVVFSFLSVYITVSAIYDMGRRDAEKKFRELEQIRDWDLQPQRDSIKNLLKQFDYGTYGLDTGADERKA